MKRLVSKTLGESLVKRVRKILDTWRSLKGETVMVGAKNLKPKLAKVIAVSETGKVLLYYYPQLDWEDIDFADLITFLDTGVGLDAKEPTILPDSADEVPGLERDDDGFIYM